MNNKNARSAGSKDTSSENKTGKVVAMRKIGTGIESDGTRGSSEIGMTDKANVDAGIESSGTRGASEIGATGKVIPMRKVGTRIVSGATSGASEFGATGKVIPMRRAGGGNESGGTDSSSGMAGVSATRSSFGGPTASGAASGQRDSLRLPLAFIAAGIVCFVLYHALTIAQLGRWAAETPRSPVGWSQTHLLLLGWAAAVAMGAVYQLIRVVINGGNYSEKLAWVHWALFVAGAAGLIVGFRVGEATWIAAAAAMTLLGIFTFTWNVWGTLIRAPERKPIALSTGVAAACLTAAALLGTLMGLDFRFGWFARIHDHFLAAHIWLAAAGWFGLLIIAYSYKLLPMFSLSHGYSETWGRRALITWLAGIALGTAAFLLNWPEYFKIAALAVMAVAFVLHQFQLDEILRHKFKPTPGAGIAWSVRIHRAFTTFAIVITVCFAFYPDQLSANSRAVPLLVWAFLWGWVGLTILCYMSKIVPFLWWTHKYGPLAGKTKVPLVADLLNDRVVNALLYGLVGATVVLLIGIGAGNSIITAVGSTLVSCASLVYIAFIALVFRK